MNKERRDKVMLVLAVCAVSVSLVEACYAIYTVFIGR